MKLQKCPICGQEMTKYESKALPIIEQGFNCPVCEIGFYSYSKDNIDLLANTFINPVNPSMSRQEIIDYHEGVVEMMAECY
jgi:transposase-like protein